MFERIKDDVVESNSVSFRIPSQAVVDRRYGLFDGTALGGLRLCCTGSGKLARLHKLANVPRLEVSRLARESLVRVDTATYDCRKRLPPSSFSCSHLTDSTRSTMLSRLAWSAFACLVR